MLLLNNMTGEIEPPRSKAHAANQEGLAVLMMRHKSPLLTALMLASCSLLMAPVAEAAKPKAAIAKVASVNEGEVVTLDGSGSSDKDGDTLAFAWTQTKIKAGVTPTVTINNAGSANATFTAPAITKTSKLTKPVKLTFQLTVDDGNQGIAKKSVVVTVKPVNALPVARAGTDRTVSWAAATSGVSLDASGSTDDGQIVKHQWKLLTKKSQLPKKSKFKLLNAKAANASFTLTSPDQTSPIPLDFELSVIDNDKKTATDTVRITVSQALPLSVANAGSDQTVTAGVAVNLNGGQSTGTIDAYLWEQTAGPAVTLTSTNTAATGFTAPTVTEPTVLTFKLTTTNSSGSSDDTVDVTVNPIAVTPPVADAGNDQTVTAGVAVNLDGGQSTGTIDTYLWEQTAGPIVTLTSTNTAATGFTAPTVTEPTVLTFKLTTTNSGGTSEANVNITVNPATQSGDLSATLSVELAEIDINDPAQAVIKDISGGDKPYAVTFDWGDGQTTGPTALADDADTLSGEHYYAEEGDYTVKVTVTDANNQTKDFTASLAVSALAAECN